MGMPESGRSMGTVDGIRIEKFNKKRLFEKIRVLLKPK